MIVHNLMVKLKDGSDANIAATCELLMSLQGKIEGMRELKVAPDIRRAASSYDIMLVAKFATMEDFQAYLPHPVHVGVATKLKEGLAAMATVLCEE